MAEGLDVRAEAYLPSTFLCVFLSSGSVRLPGKWNSNSHGARPDHLIITMIKWIRTSRLSIHTWAVHVAEGLDVRAETEREDLLQGLGLRVYGLWFMVYGLEFRVEGSGFKV